MSEPATPEREFTREEMQSAHFAQLVIQQTNIAMMLLGKTPHPETGQTMRDLEAARMFIDQLEMLEAKTNGNLTAQESGLLKQSLTALRMAFVEAVDAPVPAPAAKPPDQPVEKPDAPENKTAPTEIIGAEQEESHKRFTKKY